MDNSHKALCHHLGKACLHELSGSTPNRQVIKELRNALTVIHDEVSRKHSLPKLRLVLTFLGSIAGGSDGDSFYIPDETKSLFPEGYFKRLFTQLRKPFGNPDKTAAIGEFICKALDINSTTES